MCHLSGSRKENGCNSMTRLLVCLGQAASRPSALEVPYRPLMMSFSGKKRKAPSPPIF